MVRSFSSIRVMLTPDCSSCATTVRPTGPKPATMTRRTDFAIVGSVGTGGTRGRRERGVAVVGHRWVVPFIVLMVLLLVRAFMMPLRGLLRAFHRCDPASTDNHGPRCQNHGRAWNGLNAGVAGFIIVQFLAQLPHFMRLFTYGSCVSRYASAATALLSDISHGCEHHHQSRSRPGRNGRPTARVRAAHRRSTARNPAARRRQAMGAGGM